MISTILIVLLIVALIGGLPAWGFWGPNGSPYGYYPSSGVGLVLLIVLILLLLGRL